MRDSVVKYCSTEFSLLLQYIHSTSDNVLHGNGPCLFVVSYSILRSGGEQFSFVTCFVISIQSLRPQASYNIKQMARIFLLEFYSHLYFTVILSVR